MIELHRRDILEPVADQGFERGIAGRHKAAVHQRKRVVGEPGMQPGDKPAGDDRQRDQRDDHLARAAPYGAPSLSPEGERVG